MRLPADESARQAALHATGLLDGEADEAFDDIVALAAVVCAAPAATLTLVDGDRQWFKARVGIGIDETPRAESICARAIADGAPLFEVHDVLHDPALAMRPTDIGGRLLRFYAGVPLRDPQGHALGTLCVIWTTTRGRCRARSATGCMRWRGRCGGCSRCGG